eukprot:CAMPEP_0198269666 /NCGR_PEP_ID=MMETSP1447-20131203/42157_1 /TAXON_ID=420782 /ORGANISM="Chaetoceros dichaeta, Strain CCMP1751" /LENGTH=36 /DNA_ID= /DNA_START= /DNA_END= /DNA_ORIENTATION=
MTLQTIVIDPSQQQERQQPQQQRHSKSYAMNQSSTL